MWSHVVPQSYWQRGFNDGKNGYHEAWPTTGGPYCIENTSYRNGYWAGVLEYEPGMSQKLTPWFPESVAPSRSGVYQTQYKDDPPGFSFWSGRAWSMTGCNVAHAMICAKYESGLAHKKRWRGLATPPKEKQ